MEKDGEWITDLRDAKTLGEFVLELGELVKLGECTSREFSRAINLAKWSPALAQDSMNVTEAVDLMLALIRTNTKLGSYDNE